MSEQVGRTERSASTPLEKAIEYAEQAEAQINCPKMTSAELAQMWAAVAIAERVNGVAHMLDYIDGKLGASAR